MIIRLLLQMWVIANVVLFSNFCKCSASISLNQEQMDLSVLLSLLDTLKLVDCLLSLAAGKFTDKASR